MLKHFIFPRHRCCVFTAEKEKTLYLKITEIFYSDTNTGCLFSFFFIFRITLMGDKVFKGNPSVTIAGCGDHKFNPSVWVIEFFS